jgi:peptidoglycan hydrolase-like protein with peptidoglycan-binding domain
LFVFSKDTRVIRLLKLGSRSDEVRALQELLNSVPSLTGPKLDIDGIFGPKTQARVIEYQRLSHLAPDGIVGPKTAGTLFLSAASPQWSWRRAVLPPRLRSRG